MYQIIVHQLHQQLIYTGALQLRRTHEDGTIVELTRNGTHCAVTLMRRDQRPNELEMQAALLGWPNAPQAITLRDVGKCTQSVKLHGIRAEFEL